MRRFCSLFETISFDDPRKRLVKFILNMLPEERHDRNDASCLSFTHEEIAQRIGLARETVTRHLNALKRQRLIDLKPRQIIVCNKKGLEKLLV